jgi:hypothetical protein
MGNSYAQLNYFFPDSNSYFSVSYIKYWFQGDTVIDNLKYKKVYEQIHDSIADFDRAYYYAAIREDTVTEKIYCYYDNEEYLLYDFSVKIGETIRFYSFWGRLREREQIVESIDSVLIDGYYRKKINFDDGYQTGGIESWIEGIGSTHGLFFAGSFDEVDGMDWTHLLCVHIEGRLIYESNENLYSKYNCFIAESKVNIIENISEISKIYPNIVQDFLFVEFMNEDSYFYEIFNMQGIEVKSDILGADYINVSTLKQGFYIIRFLNNKEQKTHTEKFIKY